MALKFLSEPQFRFPASTLVAVGAMKRALDIYIDGGRFAIAAKAEKDIAEIYEAEGNLTDVRSSTSTTSLSPSWVGITSKHSSTALF